MRYDERWAPPGATRTRILKAEPMTETLARRRLLQLAGASAAGAAGLTLSGCSAGSRPAGTAPAAGASAGQRFVSRPDLTPPRIAVARHGLRADSRYIFLNAPYSGPGHGGTVLIDSHGELVWLGPNTADRHRLTFSAQTYRGRPVLTWFQGLVVEGYGQGELVVADSSYRTIQTVHAANGVMADFHEFVITPQDTALVTAYRTHHGVDLSGVGGPPAGVLLSGVAQEIDIATGRLLFEWDSINHVPVNDEMEARAQRFRHHLRRPVPGRRNLLGNRPETALARQTRWPRRRSGVVLRDDAVVGDRSAGQDYCDWTSSSSPR